MPLPVVKVEIGASLRRDMRGKSDQVYATTVLERLMRENPCIADFVAEYAMAPGTLDPVGVIVAAVLVYRLLESQQEADDLAKDHG